ncbi:MAG TPA: DUF2867 domain-containing protein [Nocardioides sp.]|nr:DUF2867 domain-containing protein [Nocardioides sp.]
MPMRVPNQQQLERPWRIHEVVTGFELEDVWTLPEISGSADDFASAIALFADSDPAHARNLPTRLLWRVRDALGRWFDLGGISESVDGTGGLPIPGSTETTLLDRLPADLRGTAQGVRFAHLPFVPLFRTDDEFAAEISNRTVHGVMHLGWVAQGDGTYRGQMAVYVAPRGAFGAAYMAFIKPFRYLVVYPALERQLAKAWTGRSRGAGELR